MVRDPSHLCLPTNLASLLLHSKTGQWEDLEIKLCLALVGGALHTQALSGWSLGTRLKSRPTQTSSQRCPLTFCHPTWSRISSWLRAGRTCSGLTVPSSGQASGVPPLALWWPACRALPSGSLPVVHEARQQPCALFCV